MMQFLKGVLASLLFIGVVLATTPCSAAATIFGIPRHSWDLTLRVINFAILAYVLVKYGKDPLITFLRGQRQRVSVQFETLEGDEQKLKDLQMEQDDLLAGLDSKIEEIKKYYHEIGEKEKRQILKRAEEIREFMLRDADASAAREFAEAQKQFRAEVVDLAVMLAGERIKKKLNESDQGKLVTTYVQQLKTAEAPTE